MPSMYFLLVLEFKNTLALGQTLYYFAQTS